MLCELCRARRNVLPAAKLCVHGLREVCKTMHGVREVRPERPAVHEGRRCTTSRENTINNSFQINCCMSGLLRLSRHYRTEDALTTSLIWSPSASQPQRAWAACTIRLWLSRCTIIAASFSRLFFLQKFTLYIKIPIKTIQLPYIVKMLIANHVVHLLGYTSSRNLERSTVISQSQQAFWRRHNQQKP